MTSWGGDVDVVLMRGGTSKGVFVRMGDLPPAGSERDEWVLALMGSPDPMQLNGLGGTHSSTSKVVAVGPSDRAGIDVEYLFGQVSVDQPQVDWAGNCGNLTVAVGPYAVDEGITSGESTREGTGERTVSLLNLNTGVRIASTLSVRSGRHDWAGSFSIDGVPGTGSQIATDYLDPAGSVTSGALPTGNAVDTVHGVQVSIVDVTTPHVFVAAADLGLRGDETQAELNADEGLLARLAAIRSACGELVGVRSDAVPRMVLVSAPTSSEADIAVRATSMGKVHHAVPVTGAMCTAAAVLLDGTVPSIYRPTRARTGERDTVVLEHLKGRLDVRADVAGSEVRSVGVVSTARRILTGRLHLPC